jgi:hypothetical protein
MIVRVTLKSMDGIGERIRFDLCVDKDMRPLSGMVYFGFYGALNDTEVSGAVLLNTEGVIDLGWGFEARGRFHKTNVLTKKMELGAYATVWWKWEAEPTETTFIVEAVTQLSALTDLVTIPKATSVNIESLAGSPRFRARIVESFDIDEYDGVVYRPPVGVEGDVANFQDLCVFCPDNAASKSGQIFTVTVDPDLLELIDGEHNPQA